MAMAARNTTASMAQLYGHEMDTPSRAGRYTGRLHEAGADAKMDLLPSALALTPPTTGARKRVLDDVTNTSMPPPSNAIPRTHESSALHVTPPVGKGLPARGPGLAGRGADGFVAHATPSRPPSVRPPLPPQQQLTPGSSTAQARDSDAEDTSVWPSELETPFREALALYPPLGRRKSVLVDASGTARRLGRNELISEYIFQKTGQRRTHKQVSSHVQTLKRIAGLDPELKRVLGNFKSVRGRGAQARTAPDSRTPPSAGRRQQLLKSAPAQEYHMPYLAQPQDQVVFATSSAVFAVSLAHLSMQAVDRVAMPDPMNMMDYEEVLRHIYTLYTPTSPVSVIPARVACRELHELRLEGIPQQYVGQVPILRTDVGLRLPTHLEDAAGSLLFKTVLMLRLASMQPTHPNNELFPRDASWSCVTAIEAYDELIKTLHQPIPQPQEMSPPDPSAAPHQQQRRHVDLELPFIASFWASFLEAVSRLGNNASRAEALHQQDKVLAGIRIVQAIRYHGDGGERVVALLVHTFRQPADEEDIAVTVSAIPWHAASLAASAVPSKADPRVVGLGLEGVQ